MKTIMISTFALLFASITAGGCVMDGGEEEVIDEEETAEVEQGLINWPTKSPVRACRDSCTASYNECRLEYGADACYDDWNKCLAMCDFIFGPISKY